MNDVLQLKKANCKNCHKCIRHCPVKSIRFGDGQAQIVPDECILCGMCFVTCPQNAKEIRDDIHLVEEAMNAGKPVYASVAPSFIADFDVSGIAEMEKALIKLGFAGAEETAIGADLVKREYQKLVDSGKHRAIISSCCHSINLLIQKYYPTMLPYLADVLSPMQAHCKLMKEQHPGAVTVFIGPCISKKDEAAGSAHTDIVLTFDELREWMARKDISFERTPRETQEGKRARFFPTTGGILKSMDHVQNFNYIAIDGVENCVAAFRELEEGRLQNVFIEMSACEGSCINGPCIREHGQHRVSGAMKVVEYGGKADFACDLEDLHKEHAYLGIHQRMPGNDAIREVLAEMGKTLPEHELNCGTCGYNTCREKAIAVCQGKADLTMCLPYLKEKAESFSDKIIGNSPNGIFVLNEDLVVEQINAAACEMFNLKSPNDILHEPVIRLLSPTDYLNVVLTGKNVYNKRHYIAEYKKFVEETIVYDKRYHIVVSFMRDVTEQEQVQEENRELRQQTVEITDKVIDKQMRVVQEIASLLGETAAETKIALSNLKETLQK